METLWYGEVINVNFDGTVHQTETIKSDQRFKKSYDLASSLIQAAGHWI